MKFITPEKCILKILMEYCNTASKLNKIFQQNILNQVIFIIIINLVSAWGMQKQCIKSLNYKHYFESPLSDMYEKNLVVLKLSTAAVHKCFCYAINDPL